MARTILRLPKVQARMGLSKSSVYQRVSEGTLTAPVHVGPRASGWPDDEVDAVNDARIAGKTDDEIRDLVRQLHAARTAVH